MLILSRQFNEGIHLTLGDRTARVFVAEIRGDVVKLGIEAEREVVVLRDELVGKPAGERYERRAHEG